MMAQSVLGSTYQSTIACGRLNWCKHHRRCRLSLEYRRLRLLSTKTHYDVLSVKKDASAGEIKSAYIKLSRLTHPDLHPDHPEKHKENQIINAAYQVLKTPLSRKEYDQTLVTQDGSFGSPYGTGPLHRNDGNTAEDSEYEKRTMEVTNDQGVKEYREYYINRNTGEMAFARPDERGLGVSFLFRYCCLLGILAVSMFSFSIYNYIRVRRKEQELFQQLMRDDPSFRRTMQRSKKENERRMEVVFARPDERGLDMSNLFRVFKICAAIVAVSIGFSIYKYQWVRRKERELFQQMMRDDPSFRRTMQKSKKQHERRMQKMRDKRRKEAEA